MIQTERIIFQRRSNLSTLSHKDVKTSKIDTEKKKNNKYKLLIKKIAHQLQKRIFFPKCKIFKIYLPYRTLVLRIAQGLKKTAKKLNFWEKNDSQMTEQDINEIQEIASTACKIIQNQGKSKKNQKKKGINLNLNQDKNKIKKSPKLKLTLIKKNEEKKLDIKKQKKANKNEVNTLEKKIEYLQNLEINRDNIKEFINNFYSFLDKNNIEVMRDNKLPSFSQKEDEILLTKKIFWIKYIIYISNKYKNELNIYHFLNFIEQFYLWCDSQDQNMDFIVEIKLQILQIFDEKKINNFLLSNKLQNLDQLFERYKSFNTVINNKENFFETKLDIKEPNNCDCPMCKEKGYINKVIEYNKTNNQMLLSQKNNFFISSTNVPNYYTGFEQDKTLYNNKSNIEYSILSQNKYYDNEIFNYLSRIEQGKIESERKKTRSSKKKKKTDYSAKKESKEVINEEKKEINKVKEKKRKSNNKINAILDLMGIKGDINESDETEINENNNTKNARKKK